MADLTGATILKDDEDETVVSMPNRAPQSAPEGGIPYRPGDPLAPAVPGQPGDAAMLDAASAFAEPGKFTQTTDKGKISGQIRPISTPVDVKRPVAPQAPSTVPVASPEEFPTTEPLEDPNKSYGTQAAFIIQGANAEKLGRKEEQKLNQEAILGKVQAQKDAEAEYLAQAKQEQEKLDAIEDQKRALEDQYKKILASGQESPERSLGNRLMWGLATFLAGIGGKGESVMNMLLKTMELDSQERSRRIASAQQAMKGNKGSSQDERQIQAQIYRLKLLAAKAATEKKMEEAKSPEEKARGKVFVAKVDNALRQNLASNEENRFKTKEAQQQYVKSTLGAKPIPMGKAIPQEAFTDTDSAKKMVSVPGTQYAFKAKSEKEAEAINTHVTTLKEINDIKNEFDRLRKSGNFASIKIPQTAVHNQLEALSGKMIRVGIALGKLGVPTGRDLEIVGSSFPIGGDATSWFNKGNYKLDETLKLERGTMKNMLKSNNIPMDPRFVQ